MTVKAHSDIRRKLKVLSYSKEIGNITKVCRYFGVSRETFYQWKQAYEVHEEIGLINRKPCPVNLKLRTPQNIQEQIIHLETTYHLGQKHIMWYLSHFDDISISEGAMVLKGMA